MPLLNLSFIQLMNSYLEQIKCPVSPDCITMELFDLTVAYEIDFVKLLKLENFQKNLNHAIEEKIEEKKEHKNNVRWMN